MRLDELRRSRERWRARAEETRLRDKKEEARELFQRHPRLGPITTEEFERDFERKVVNSRLGSSSQLKQNRLRIWTDEMQKKAQVEDHMLEGWERKRWSERTHFPNSAGHGRKFGNRYHWPLEQATGV